MIIEPIRPVEDWTLDEWRDAFNALTELYNAAVKRAERAEGGLASIHDRAAAAMSALNDYYSTYAVETTAELYKQNAEQLKRIAQLERVNAALLQAAQRGGEGG